MGFLSFCVMRTAWLLRLKSDGMDAGGWTLDFPGTFDPGRMTVAGEERLEALWPMYGTGPPAKGP